MYNHSNFTFWFSRISDIKFWSSYIILTGVILIRVGNRTLGNSVDDKKPFFYCDCICRISEKYFSLSSSVWWHHVILQIARKFVEVPLASIFTLPWRWRLMLHFPFFNQLFLVSEYSDWSSVMTVKNTRHDDTVWWVLAFRIDLLPAGRSSWQSGAGKRSIRGLSVTLFTVTCNYTCTTLIHPVQQGRLFAGNNEIPTVLLFWSV